MKYLHYILLLLVAMLASCSNDSFKIDGEIVNLEGYAVKVVLRGDSGIVEEQVNVDKKGKFSYHGIASQPTIVSVMSLSNKPLALLVATNGDHLKLKGDASKEMSIKVKGNRLNEEWQLFRDEHATFYTDPNSSRLDAAIEKYVREHPADMLSTVLLMADYSDYSDRDKVVKMLKEIDPNARPESLTQVFPGNPLTIRKPHLPRLMTLMLWKHGSGFEEIKLTNRIVLLSMWGNPQPDRKALVQKLQGIRESDINVIDILAESDTMRWHQTIVGEEWSHYWAPGGPLEQGIQLLDITSLPWYAITDSTGLVVYSGPSLDEAGKEASRLIK